MAVNNQRLLSNTQNSLTAFALSGSTTGFRSGTNSRSGDPFSTASGGGRGAALLTDLQHRRQSHLKEEEEEEEWSLKEVLELSLAAEAVGARGAGEEDWRPVASAHRPGSQQPKRGVAKLLPPPSDLFAFRAAPSLGSIALLWRWLLLEDVAACGLVCRAWYGLPPSRRAFML